MPPVRGVSSVLTRSTSIVALSTTAKAFAKIEKAKALVPYRSPDDQPGQFSDEAQQSRALDGSLNPSRRSAQDDVPDDLLETDETSVERVRFSTQSVALTHDLGSAESPSPSESSLYNVAALGVGLFDVGALAKYVIKKNGLNNEVVGKDDPDASMQNTNVLENEATGEREQSSDEALDSGIVDLDQSSVIDVDLGAKVSSKQISNDQGDSAYEQPTQSSTISLVDIHLVDITETEIG